MERKQKLVALVVVIGLFLLSVACDVADVPDKKVEIVTLRGGAICWVAQDELPGCK